MDMTPGLHKKLTQVMLGGQFSSTFWEFHWVINGNIATLNAAQFTL